MNIIEYINAAPLGVKVSDIKTFYGVRLSEARSMLQGLLKDGTIIVYKVHNCTYYSSKERYPDPTLAVHAQRAAQEAAKPKSTEDYAKRILDHLRERGEMKLKDLRNGIRIRRIYLNSVLTELINQQKIEVNRRGDGQYVSITKVKPVRTVPEISLDLKQAHLTGEGTPETFTQEETALLSDLKMVMENFSRLGRETKHSVSRRLKMPVEDAELHLKTLVDLGYLSSHKVGDLVVYKTPVRGVA